MSDSAKYRSGAVARLVGMPVTTLRVWERRYGLQCAEVLPSGHRLYSSADVQRIALLKRLTQLGYAIGSIVTLEDASLQAIELNDVQNAGISQPHADQRPPAARVIVIGLALAQRLQKALPATSPIRVVGVFGSIELALESGSPQQAELVLMACPSLRTSLCDELADVARSWQTSSIGVIYSYGPANTCEALQAQGVALLRSPRDDASMLLWLDHILDQAGLPVASDKPLTGPVEQAETFGLVTPRRYDDLTLARLASIPSKVACECPRHIADLLMQLAHFEAYSADCEHRDDADAQLHASLGQMAGAARVLLEKALERLAEFEHIELPKLWA